MSLMQRFAAPGAAHWFGCDEYGRDVLSRVLYGARSSLSMGVLATAISLGFGVPLGLLSGYARGAIDKRIMRAMDVLMSFPPIMLGLLVLAVTQPALWKAMIAVGIVYVPGMVRVTRSVTLIWCTRSSFRRERARRADVVHPGGRDPAQCLAADRGGCEPADHLRHPARGGAELFSAWGRSRRVPTGG